MSKSDYPAGAELDEDAPFNKKEIPCDKCDEHGEGMWSCCTGELVFDTDLGLCPECKEHIVVEDCDECEGTGYVSQQQLQEEYESFKEDTNE